LPGGRFLIITWTALIIIASPFLHILIKTKNSHWSHIKVVFIVIPILIILFFVLASTGIFNFT
jgi:hypothetical protein